MSDIIFSCECGMILKVRSGEKTGGLIECPSCNASIRVPAMRAAVIAPARLEPEIEPEPELEPEEAGHQNFGIICFTLVALLAIGAGGFYLIPNLIGSRDKAPEDVLTSGSSREDSARKPGKTSRKPGNKATDRTKARKDSKQRSKSSGDASEPSAPLPRYDDATPSPSPTPPSPEASSPPGPKPAPDLSAQTPETLPSSHRTHMVCCT